MVGKSKPIIWNLIWKETAKKCVGGKSSQDCGDIPLSIQNKLLRNLTRVFLITRVTESPLHTPLFKLSLHIPPAVNQLLFPALLQVFQTAPPPELHPSPVSVYTTGPAKTDDCSDGKWTKVHLVPHMNKSAAACKLLTVKWHSKKKILAFFL